MKNGKFSYSMYIVALIGGLASGLSFSKAAYHKGKKDAYEDCGNRIKETIANVEEMLEESKNEEES